MTPLMNGRSRLIVREETNARTRARRERDESNIESVTGVDELGAAGVVDLAHPKLGDMAGRCVEACWERIMRGKRIRPSQLFPKFVNL
jgi:hypothetical protein